MVQKGNLKIAIVTPAYVPAFAFGGPVIQLRRIVQALHKKGYDITVYTTNATSPTSFASLQTQEYIDDILVKRFPVLFRVAGYWFSPSMFKTLLEDDFDVIHTNCARSFQSDLASLVSRIRRIPLIIQSRGSIGSYRAKGAVSVGMSYLYSIHNPILKYSLKQAEKVIALTRSEALEYRVMGVENNKIEVIPNGIDLSDFNCLPRSGRFRENYSISADTRIILFLGRINRIKGIDVLIEAFSFLNKELDKMKLVIVGPKNGYSKFCEELVSRSDITDDILFTGPLYAEDKLEAYVDSDIFVLPSRYEAFPNVILEAFACSKPVVASDVESISDIIMNKQTGLLFKRGNSRELAEKILYILKNPEEGRKMGHMARRMVEENFSTDKVICSLEALYKKSKRKI